MNRIKEKTPTAATVSGLSGRSLDENSLPEAILPQDEVDFFTGFNEWCAKPPKFEWGGDNDMKTFSTDMDSNGQKRTDDRQIVHDEDMRLEDICRFLSWANGTLTPDANDNGTYGGMRI